MAETDYIPTSLDILWMRNVLGLIREGGALAYPSTRLIYRHERGSKRLVLVNPEVLEDAGSLETHLRTIVVCREIGYSVSSDLEDEHGS